MASRVYMLPLLLLAFFAAAQAAVFTVTTGGAFIAAASSAGDGDSIFVSNSITITSTAIFKTSISIFGQGNTLIVSQSSYGLYFRGSATTVIIVDNLIVDGASVSRFDPVIYIAGSSGAKAKAGPTATFTDVTVQNVIDIAPTIYYGRGAALEANTGSTVNFTGGAIRNNFAQLGGAVEATGASFVFFCNTLFSGNTAGPSFPAATDYWVGLQGHLAYFYDQTLPGLAGITPPSGQLNTTGSKGHAPGTTNVTPLSPGAPCPSLATAFAGIAPYSSTAAKKSPARKLYGKRHVL